MTLTPDVSTSRPPAIDSALDTMSASLLAHYPQWYANRIAAGQPVSTVTPERVIDSLNLEPAEAARLLAAPLPLRKRGKPEGGSAAAQKRTALRDRMGRIVTLDRAGTSRSIAI